MVSQQVSSQHTEHHDLSSQGHGYRRATPPKDARLLGWIGLGLGLAQFAVPREVSRLIGLPGWTDHNAIMRAIGARELLSGIGLLSQPKSAPWIWLRLAGDVMDLALLNKIMSMPYVQRDRTLKAIAAVLGISLLDLLSSMQVHNPQARTLPGSTSKGIDVRHAITVNKPVEEVYQFWHNFENLPRFMRHLESVTITGTNRSHWKARGPLGMDVEWDAMIITDRPNEQISWRSLEDADVQNAGSVRFREAPHGKGTEVRVDMQYAPPAGKLGAAFAKLFGEEPDRQVIDDLRRFKQVMETGEVIVSDATMKTNSIFQAPAQPGAADK